MLFERDANTLVSGGSIGTGKVENVAIEDVYFEDFYTGEVEDITTKWRDNDCSTAAFSVAGDGDLYGAYPNLRDSLGQGSGNDSCSYNSDRTLDEFASTQAICRGFVRSVRYIVEHKSSESAAIDSVSAQVTVSDVPITAGNSSVSVTVSQCFSADYYSGGKPQNAMYEPTLSGTDHHYISKLDNINHHRVSC